VFWLILNFIIAKINTAGRTERYDISSEYENSFNKK